MAVKLLWVVRVCLDDHTKSWFDNPFLECLRYAGVVVVHATRTPAGHTVFDVFPPKASWGDKDWAEANASRMRSFGLNAAAAPAGPYESPAPAPGAGPDRSAVS
jgi:hypothetical protein